MFRNVVAALNEAQDITLFLRPLGQHFQVSKQILNFLEMKYKMFKTNMLVIFVFLLAPPQTNFPVSAIHTYDIRGPSIQLQIHYFQYIHIDNAT